MGSGRENFKQKKKELRNKFIRFMWVGDYAENMIKKLDEDEKKEKPQMSKWDKIFFVVCAIVLIVGLVFVTRDSNDLDESENTTSEIEVAATQTEPDDLEIHSEALTSYMIDRLNGIYLKMAPTTLGDKVAYSVTYNYDIVPSGYLHYEEYYVSQQMTTVLINGYPYVSAQDMGLNSDEEAYMATQLAVYEVVSRKQMSNLENEKFSIDKVVASSDEYSDMVDRIKTKAKELVENAFSNTYENKYSAYIAYGADDVCTKNEEDGSYTIGPVYMNIGMTDEALKLVAQDYNPTTSIEIKNYIGDESKVVILDSDGNEIDKVEDGQMFYVKFLNGEKCCASIKCTKETQMLVSKIYYNDTSEKQYVCLDLRDTSYTDIVTWHNHYDTGKIEFNFTDTDGESLGATNFYIYNENRELVWNINDLYLDYITLPVGKYYIQEYEAPKNYLLNSNEYEVEVKKDETVECNIVHDSLF